MKEYIRNMLAILYGVSLSSSVILAMEYPLAIGCGAPKWPCFIIYPLAILLAAAYPQVNKSLEK